MYDTDIMQVMQKNDARREKHAVVGMPTSYVDRLQLEERDTAVAYGEGDVYLTRHFLLALSCRREFQFLEHTHRLGIELAPQGTAHLIVADSPLGRDFTKDKYGAIHPPRRLYLPELLLEEAVQPLHSATILGRFDRLLLLLGAGIGESKTEKLSTHGCRCTQEDEQQRSDDVVMMMSHNRVISVANLVIIYLFQK